MSANNGTAGGARKRVLVLMGGWSAEREVSLSSGAEVARALIEHGYRVDTLDVTRDVGRLMAALSPKPDVVFNALHGKGGEDGTIQGLLDLLEIPYTHSGVLASALAMDKPAAKQAFVAAGLRCPEGIVVPREVLLRGDVMSRPYVVKPPAEGSSVGVRIVREHDNAQPFDGESWRFGEEVLVERYIPGREITVAVLGEPTGPRALGALEIRPRGGFYDYTAKYTDGQAAHLMPAPLAPAVYDEALRIAETAHRELGCRGVSRADLRYDDTRGEPGLLYLLEVNTQPGMTPLSLVPEIAAAAGIAFPQLVAWMVENAAWGT
ncbi:MAG TPA: D-alanine--D-alanine ligase [Candidatus Sulfotelmatobacter sp.]|nr:D-alanine--D-alanine ligase [Candidatus Sulfotelmatobacter sp.]